MATTSISQQAIEETQKSISATLDKFCNKLDAHLNKVYKEYVIPQNKARNDEALLIELRKLIKFGYPSHAIATAYDLVYQQAQSEKEDNFKRSIITAYVCMLQSKKESAQFTVITENNNEKSEQSYTVYMKDFDELSQKIKDRINEQVNDER